MVANINVTKEPQNKSPKQYTKSELDVIWHSKVRGFGAYLQACWSEYPHITRNISKGNYPKKEELRGLTERMEMERMNFDYVYFISLPERPVNPLQEEQKAWTEVSPKVNAVIERFEQILQNYPENNLSDELKRQVKDNIESWWNILQDWNKISESYKPKVEAAYSAFPQKGGALDKIKRYSQSTFEDLQRT